LKEKFQKRTYQGLGEVWEDFHYIIKRRPIIRRAMRELLSPAFRERLMLVVTEVNGCRYCRTFHASEALKEGITDTELAELLKRLRKVLQTPNLQSYWLVRYPQMLPKKRFRL
jgi:AhpD family alkylhydroperoxidase